MGKESILEQLGQKGVDIEAIANRVIDKPEEIAELTEAIKVEKRAVKFSYEKVLRLVSERKPELIYPYFGVFEGLLDSDNSFLKWGAILTIGNLAAVDEQKKLEALFEKYYAPIKGLAMVTAASIIGSSAKIALAKPELTERITQEILQVEKAEYESKGQPSPECRNVAIGHAIDSFDKFFEQIEDKKAVIAFVERQLNNTRKQVVKKAERFIRKHASQT
ncbi:MAG: hypothetical protein JW837_05900 [Sedimentisphaerales bacterium]|nr:hypothetical protein [Sedimentisphaerales bacterium]